MFFVGPSPRHPAGNATGRRSDGSGTEPVPGFRRLLTLAHDPVATTELCEQPSGRLAILTMGINPVPHGIRISYLDWLERLAGIAGHRYIADVLAGGITTDHRPYLAVPAGADTLAGRLREAGSAPVEVTRSLGTGLAEALALAHERTLRHGTVCPATVLIDEAGNPLLGGFDTAAPGLERLPPPGPYTAPELVPGVAGGRFVTSTAGDVYGLAATLYVMVGGRLPGAGAEPAGDAALPDPPEPPGDGLAGMPGALARAVLRGLVANPERRLALPGLREQLVTMTPDGVDRPGQPVPGILLRGDGIRPLATPRTDPPAEAPTPAPRAAAPAPEMSRQEDSGPGLSGPSGEPRREAGGRGRRMVSVAAALAVAVVAVAVVAGLGGPRSRAPAPAGEAGVASGPPAQSTPVATPSLGVGKRVAAPSSSSADRSPTPSASPTPTPRPSSSPARRQERDASVAALVGRWSESRPWEGGQSSLKFTRRGQMSLTGPSNCSGRARPSDGGGQRTYELSHNCDDSGYAVIVLSDDGHSLAVFWDRDTSDGYTRD